MDCAPGAQAERSAAELRALLRLSNLFASLHGSDQLARSVLELVFELIPADRGSVLVLGSGADARPPVFRVLHTAFRAGGDGQEMTLSRTVAEAVVAERVAILSNRVVEVPRWSEAESLAGTRALLCTPFVLGDQVTGLLYQQEGRPDREAKAAGVGVSRQRPARRRSGVRMVFESFRE